MLLPALGKLLPVFVMLLASQEHLSSCSPGPMDGDGRFLEVFTQTVHVTNEIALSIA